MNFLDIEFPKELFPNFGKSLKYLTSVARMQSGEEFRRSLCKKQVCIYTLVQAIKKTDMISILEDFFHTVNGRMYSFKMYDLMDCELPVTKVQKIAEHAVQIQKIINVQGVENVKKITKPKETSIKVFKNNVLMVSGYQIDAQKGIITFVDGIANDEIAVSCEYFKHVRFNTDTITFSMKGEASFEVDNVEIIEILD